MANKSKVIVFNRVNGYKTATVRMAEIIRDIHNGKVEVNSLGNLGSKRVVLEKQKKAI